MKDSLSVPVKIFVSVIGLDLFDPIQVAVGG